MLTFSSVQSLSHVWLCDPMNCLMPGLPVHHQLTLSPFKFLFLSLYHPPLWVLCAFIPLSLNVIPFTEQMVRSKVLNQELVSDLWITTTGCFCKSSFVGTAVLICWLVFSAAFHATVADFNSFDRNVWLRKLKIFTIRLFIEKAWQPLC